ncbi:unnamed protein product [Fraxinus pennsylvanica]|uniref:PB1 domain-containing protein n=1 Tax=Fraxinus pennsylvanica TaxID=56036 RepID=A0AAD2E305_9LAMI|nr:unnamed protein product [Fraxinus pennsylvanica]
MNLAVKPTTIKFLCSYGGRILPRYPDGKLRYHGGETRVLSVERSISFAELLMKLGEMCGTSVVNLRCQLPTEDLDALVSITSDEDLANLIEEYERVAPPVAGAAAPSLKIRAFLSAPKTTKTVSPPPSTTSPESSYSVAATFMLPPRYPKTTGGGGGGRCFRHVRRPPVYVYTQPAGEITGETPHENTQDQNPLQVGIYTQKTNTYISSIYSRRLKISRKNEEIKRYRKKNSRFIFISGIKIEVEEEIDHRPAEELFDL